MTRKQYVSMHKMQKLQPLLKEAQKRFKKDQKKLGEVTMAIYQRTGVNPLGTCLPILVQLPVFFALYSAFYSCIELRQASFLWISDLANPERLQLGFTLPLGFTELTTINILPILMTAIWFVQQSLTPKPSDPNQQATQKIMKFMPLIFFFIFYTFPSGLVLYWLVRNITNIAETLWIKRGLRLKDEQGESPIKSMTLDKILKDLKKGKKQARKGK
ncbi:MAG: membrane protein insertase YidC [Planctomycetota bacterium]|nr:membrane protein insertase YidC [Planctomycetota bacterium]